MTKIHYLNKIRSHLVTIAPMALLTPKSTSNVRSALHSRYSSVIPRFTSRAKTAQSQKPYNHGLHNTFDYNHYIYSD